jgi:hypothetical protein
MESVNKMAALARSIDMTETRVQYPGKSTKNRPETLPINNLNTLFSNITKIVKNFKKEAKIGTGKKILLIDNYDSYTWNLYQYLCQLGTQVSHNFLFFLIFKR